MIYTALLLGNLLSELLGRWWLTRVRKAQDARLHRDMGQTIHWIDGLDAHGPALQRGLVMLQELWIKLAKPKRTPIGSLSLIVLDIAHYRTTVQIHSNDPIPVQAQQHIDCAITAVFGGALKQWYWFANDHALLILEDCERAKADTYAQRIRERVEAQPLMLPGSEQQGIELAVRTAVRTMSYQSFLDLGYSGDDQDGGKRTTDQLFAHLNEIIEHLRYKAGIVEQQETKGVSLPIKRRIVRHTEVWSR